MRNKFKQGQTVYLITNNAFEAFFNNEPLRYWVEPYTVTNEPEAPEFCIQFYDGKVSRHWLNRPHRWSWVITRSRRVAMRRARVLAQCQGATL